MSERSKHTFSYRLSPGERTALEATAALKGVREADVARELMALGLKAVMSRDSHGVRASYLNPITDSQSIGELYVQWLDGHATVNGVQGPLGNRYTLEESAGGWLPVLNAEFSRWPRDVAELLDSLGSPDARERLLAGYLLMDKSGRHVGPHVHALVSKAVGGDAEALAALAEIVKEG